MDYIFIVSSACYDETEIVLATHDINLAFETVFKEKTSYCLNIWKNNKMIIEDLDGMSNIDNVINLFEDKVKQNYSDLFELSLPILNELKIEFDKKLKKIEDDKAEKKKLNDLKTLERLKHKYE